MPSLIDYSPAALRSLLRPSSSTDERRAKQLSGGSAGGAMGIFKMFKLMPMLSTGCKMAAMLGRHHNHHRGLLADHAPTVTLFGHRRGRISLAIHEDTRSPPAFLIELPMLAAALHREMATGVVKLALESDTRGVAARRRRPLLEEYVWAVYCNGRKAGYAIRRKDASDDERHVMRLLRGVSMGAGVLPPPPPDVGARVAGGGAATPNAGPDGELTYMRARVERVVGSKDSEAFYMINPDGGRDNASRGGDSAPELSIFFVRNK
ncbi:hypothetical protein HU200_006572 [Digitaria exilis]|uniref:Protein MIZU-KUSSEI 1 n=1 Tax=Digitaria exilis TaxID=1010633 RepID=A0A835KQM4_9POAL|nr:hypothetical protein HU200_006572 [Digitaria exilis]